MKVLAWIKETSPTGEKFRAKISGVVTGDEIIVPGFFQGTKPKTFDKWLSLSVPEASIEYKHEAVPELTEVLSTLGYIHRNTIQDAILFALEKYKRASLNTNKAVEAEVIYVTSVMMGHDGGVFDTTSKPDEITVYLF